jgi:hypothetical protein
VPADAERIVNAAQPLRDGSIAPTAAEEGGCSPQALEVHAGAAGQVLQQPAVQLSDDRTCHACEPMDETNGGAPAQP